MSVFNWYMTREHVPTNRWLSSYKPTWPCIERDPRKIAQVGWPGQRVAGPNLTYPPPLSHVTSRLAWSEQSTFGQLFSAQGYINTCIIYKIRYSHEYVESYVSWCFAVSNQILPRRCPPGCGISDRQGAKRRGT